MPRGSTLELQDVLRVEQAYNDLLQQGYVPGADRIIQLAKKRQADFPLKRGAVRRTIAKLQVGRKPCDIVGNHCSGRGRVRKVRTGALVDKIGAIIAEQGDTVANSSRKLAAKQKVGAITVRRGLKLDMGKTLFKRAKSAVSAEVH